jgi:DNA-binding PadR family transcriptional regulator
MENGIAWPSGKELEVLRHLNSELKGMYGLQVVERSGGAIGRASVYILLSRLEDKGYVSVTRPKTADHPGMPRPIYKINALGKKALAIAEAVSLGFAGAHP